MAWGTGGLDLSEAVIIMDSIAIKNSPFMQMFFETHTQCWLTSSQDAHSAC